MIATPAKSRKVPDYLMEMVYERRADCGEKVLYCVSQKLRVLWGTMTRGGGEGWWLLQTQCGVRGLVAWVSADKNR